MSKNSKKLFTNLTFWSAVCGFVGAILTIVYGLPAEIHADGHGYLMLEQVDQNQIQIATTYGVFDKMGLVLITISFLLQLIEIIRNSEMTSKKRRKQK